MATSSVCSRQRAERVVWPKSGWAPESETKDASGPPRESEKMRSPVQILAEIRLNLSCVERFCEIACGLADDNQEIKSGVWDAAKEACSAARLIDHLRSLFSHQQCVEEHAGSTSATSFQVDMPYLRLAQLATSAPEQQHPYTYSNYLQHELATDENSLLFTRTNQLNLYRASKCLLANIAKILYLTDSVLLPTESYECQSEAYLKLTQAGELELQQHENRAKVSVRARVF